MDEIFGEDQFVANFIWQKRYAVSSDSQGIPAMHDHVLCYEASAAFKPGLLPRTSKQDDAYSNPDSDVRGLWRADNLLRSEYRERDYYAIINPNTQKEFWPPKGSSWRRPKATVDKMIEDGRIYFGKDGKGGPVPKRFLSEVKQGIVASAWLPFTEAGHTDEAKRDLKDVFSERLDIFATPKPVRLLERILEIGAARENSLILDSFAGSGTTAHAVLAANAKDGGNRRFILVETEDYADSLTAERVRRVIEGYKFKGTQRTELMSEKITWTQFKKAGELLEKVESIGQLEGAAYDKVKTEIKDGVLTVTGERTITEKMPGLGGSFTYCELGEPIQIEGLLTGAGLPSFESLARYVFYTATGQSLEKVPKPRADGFIGETELFRLHLFYKPDKEWLRGNEAALDEDRVKAIGEGQKGKRAVVFAVSKFMSQKELTRLRIEFCQLPYAVHRILGD